MTFDGVGFSIAHAESPVKGVNHGSEVPAASRGGIHAFPRDDSRTPAPQGKSDRNNPIRGLEQPPPPKNDDHEAQMSRMVDDLVGPQEDISRQTASVQPLLTEPLEPLRSSSVNGPQRMHSLSTLWDEPPTAPRTPSLDASMKPIGTPRGVSARARDTHSRNNSATSIASQTPYRSIGSSFVPTPPLTHAVLHKARADLPASTEFATEMHSPLLFGAGGGLWSTTPRRSVSSYTPPNGQGG